MKYDISHIAILVSIIERESARLLGEHCAEQRYLLYRQVPWEAKYSPPILALLTAKMLVLFCER